MIEFIKYRVKDFMTEAPVTIGPDVSLSAVASIFEKHDFNGVPVVSSGNKLIGMVTKLDLLKAFSFTTQDKIPPYQTIMEGNIRLLMTREPRVVSPGTPLTRVLCNMIETGYKSFPVIENDEVIGIIAREDIMNALHRAAKNSR